jgi:DNA-binding protein HU-beta
MPTKRTVLRSRRGKKLYAVRDAKGRFKDIQSYKKAHAQDIKRKSKAEKAAAKKAAKKRPAKKKVARKK